MVDDILQAKQKILQHNHNNPYVDITPYVLQIGLPIINYTGFFPQANEVIVYAAPAYTFKDKEQVLGYTGKSSGVSVRVAKGLTYRTGGSGGQAIRGNIRKYNEGDLVITNKRIVFIGKDDSFDYAVSKISAVKLLTQDSFVIQSGKSFKNIVVHDSLTIYTAGFINYVVTGYSSKLDIVAEYKQANDEMTDEQRNFCNQIKQEVLAMPYQEPKPEKKKWGCFTQFMFGVMCLLLMILIGVVGFAIYVGISGSNIDSNGNIVVPESYLDKEILSFENHPKAFDNFEITKDFYSKVSNKKVRVYNTYKNGGAYTKEEDYLLYIDNGASHNDYVSDIRINLGLSDEFKDITLDDVVKMATDYLPMEIMNEYYDVNRVFTYGNENTMSYHYSWVLNDKGIEYHNSGHYELYKNYGFVIVHNVKANTYTIKINLWARDVSKIGNHDDEWIRKNTNSWDIDLKKYY